MYTQGYNYADIMLEHMPVGVALFDAQDMRLLAANALYQSFLLPEWRDGRAIGHPLSDWGPQPYTYFIEPLLCKVAETGIPYRGEEVHIPHPKRGHTYWNWTIDPVRDSNGHIMHLLNTASDVTGQVLARQATEQAHASLSQVNTAPLYTENGDITGAVSVYHDITERKSIEQHKNEFLSIASHELCTPITAIQGFAEILQLQASEGASLDSPQTLRAITNIVEQSLLLTRLIEEMLDISRIENARLLLNLAPHDILRTLKDVIESQSITSKHHRIGLVLEGLEPNDTLIGNFDEDRMMQVFNNLISNAIKYSPARNGIEVGLHHTTERPDEVLVWVKDQGIGIPTEEMPRIFERFHRASNLDRSMSGLGIGLYLVKEIVTRHNGKVWAESSEGNGSTFYVLLPLKPTEH